MSARGFVLKATFKASDVLNVAFTTPGPAHRHTDAS